MNNKKRILVRVERLTIFVVEQENSLENAVSYYLGGVPPAVLPSRWVQPAMVWDRQHVPLQSPWWWTWPFLSRIQGCWNPAETLGEDFLSLSIILNFLKMVIFPSLVRDEVLVGVTKSSFAVLGALEQPWHWRSCDHHGSFPGTLPEELQGQILPRAVAVWGCPR